MKIFQRFYDYLLGQYRIQFAIKSKYEKKLIWLSLTDKSYCRSIKLLFEIMKVAEPETITMNGKGLDKLNICIPISPEFGIHIIGNNTFLEKFKYHG